MSYSSPSHSNTRPDEGTLSDAAMVTITYDIPVRQIMIVNNTTSTGNILFSINGQDNATLLPEESISMWIRCRTLTLTASGGTVNYRTNALG